MALRLATLLCLVSALALAACGGGGADTFTSDDLKTLHGDGFTVSMPGKPERQPITVPTAAGNAAGVVYTVKNDDEAYVIASTDLPPLGTFDLDASIEGSATGVKGSVRDKTALRYRGYPARDARLVHAKSQGEDVSVFIRAIVVKGSRRTRLFQLQHISRGADRTKPPPLYDEFVASLKIQP